MSTIFSTKPRFKVGDLVKVVRPGLTLSKEGLITEVDYKTIVPYYLVEFDKIRQQRFPEFDLYPVNPPLPNAQSNT